ncbi:MAG: GcrA family cell cycle regulator, partial [Sphingomonadaceae bacterium]
DTPATGPRKGACGTAPPRGLPARPSPGTPGDTKPKPKKAAPAGKAKPAKGAAKARARAKPRPAPKPAPAPGPASRPEAQQRPRQPEMRSIGPGGFVRQAPSDQQAPIPPAPPRRLVPAKPSAEVADKTSLLDLTEKICKWPIGHPGEPDFHFCGRPANPGFPYCVEHCGVAYQAQLPRRDRRPPPPLPFGGPRVR